MSARRKEIAGQKFGRLTVIEFAGHGHSRSALWRCKCDCGKVVVTLGRHLRGRAAQSCGSEVDGHKITINAPGSRLKFSDVRVCKFAASLDYEDHSVSLTLQAQIDPEGHLDELADMLSRVVTIDIEPPTEQDLVAQAEKASKPKPAENGNGEAHEEPKGKKRGRAFPEAVDGTSTSPLN